MKWEYRIVTFDIIEGTSLTEDYFNEMGQERWELVAVCEKTKKMRAAFFRRCVDNGNLTTEAYEHAVSNYFGEADD